MGIFNEPKRLAKLLASVKVSDSVRPLSPIKTARWLKEGVDELGGKQQVMDRVDIGKTMWAAFEKLLTIPEEIENAICWGKSNPDTLQIGFSVAHYLAEGLESSEQIALLNEMWEIDRPYTTEELKRIKSFYKSNPGISIEEAVGHILKLDRPPKKEIIFIFISGLKESICQNLKKRSEENNLSLDEFAKQIFSKNFSKNSITGIKVRQNVIRLVFSEKGKKEFNKIARDKKINKNDIVNHIFETEGF